jgi:hypothetical protein
VTDEELARLRAHNNNISRYRRLLKTNLSDLERRFLERRLSEERSAVESLGSLSRRAWAQMLEASAQRRGGEMLQRLEPLQSCGVESKLPATASQASQPEENLSAQVGGSGVPLVPLGPFLARLDG